MRSFQAFSCLKNQIKMDEIKLLVEEEDRGIRLDKFLAENLPEFSRSFLQTLIAEGNVSISEKSLKASRKVEAGEEVLVLVPPPKEIEAVPVNIPIEILYEDEHILVVNKPKGMPVHPSNGHYEDTLVNALLFSHGEKLSGINGYLRPGIVHRIDMDTTGSLIVAKTDEAHKGLAEQIKVHSFERIYLGICHGKVDMSGRIDKPVGRDKKNRLRMGIDPNGKEAITEYEAIEYFKDFTYVRFKLYTGRTHQIRVHMQSIGHPLLGDPLYGPKKCPFKLSGQTLHASIIGFEHPITGEYIRVEAPLPGYFTELLERLR